MLLQTASNRIEQHPDVAECAVFGVPDAKWGEAVHAVVVPREGTTLEEAALREHCRGLLGGYKLPKALEVRGTLLPRSAAGKVLKRELRAPHWQGRERNVS